MANEDYWDVGHGAGRSDVLVGHSSGERLRATINVSSERMSWWETLHPALVYILGLLGVLAGSPRKQLNYRAFR